MISKPYVPYRITSSLNDQLQFSCLCKHQTCNMHVIFVFNITQRTFYCIFCLASDYSFAIFKLFLQLQFQNLNLPEFGPVTWQNALSFNNYGLNNRYPISGHNVGLYDLAGNLFAHFVIIKHVLIFINQAGTQDFQYELLLL